jgi:hypothetical protein
VRDVLLGHVQALRQVRLRHAQVQDLVERRQVSADLVETLEVEGYARAADWVYRRSPDYRGVPLTVLSEIHRQTVEPAWGVDPPPTRDRPGEWRKGGVRIRGVEVSAPPAIPADLSDWSASTRETSGVPMVTTRPNS